MFSRDRWQEIFQTIRKNKLRTVLSGFTITLGIFIFILLFGMGNGLKNAFQDFFLDEVNNAIFIHSGRTKKPYKGYKSNRVIQFRNDDLMAVKRTFGSEIEYLTPRIYRNYDVDYHGTSNSYSIRGVAPDHQFIEKTIMMKGRYLNNYDLEHESKAAVIGRLVEKDLFDGRSALGEYVSIKGSVFKVIGVFQDDGGDNEERAVFLPYTTLQLMNKGTDQISAILLTFRPSLGYIGAKSLEERIREFIQKKHTIHPKDNGGFYLYNAAEGFKKANQFAQVLQLIVMFVGIGTLLAGVIGISNIMIFVVKERTKELGIRKALGATPANIIGMILQESIFITTVAGLIGLAIGVLVLGTIGLQLEEYYIKNPYIDPLTAIIATIVLIICGGIAGFVPAKRAASIKPIEALRDD